MLKLEIQLSPEGWDEVKQEFVEPKTQILQLEHSLVSLSKWESKWRKPYLGPEDKTLDETIDYIRCMTITQNVSAEVYNHISNKNIEQVNEYINDSMTATWFTEEKGTSKRGNGGQQVTSELIYYWMISLNIPFKCEKWHLNRLLTLIRVCDINTNSSGKKSSKREAASQIAALNKARRKHRK